MTGGVVGVAGAQNVSIGTQNVSSQPVTVAEVLPGRMALSSKTVVSALPVGLVVRRVVTLLADGNPAIICRITGGLTLDGADVLEAVNVVRLINLGQPRTEFT